MERPLIQIGEMMQKGSTSAGTKGGKKAKRGWKSAVEQLWEQRSTSKMMSAHEIQLDLDNRMYGQHRNV